MEERTISFGANPVIGGRPPSDRRDRRIISVVGVVMFFWFIICFV